MSTSHTTDGPVSSRDMVREIHFIAHDLAQQILAASATVDAAEAREASGIAGIRYALVGLGKSVARLRWLSTALVSAELAEVASTIDLGALVSECLANVSPSFPSSCECACTIEPGLAVQTDPALLAEALSLLLSAASLRLRIADRSGAPTQLKLRWHSRAQQSVLHLAYSAPHGAPLKAHANEVLALKVLRSFGGSVLARGTQRWSVFRVGFPRKIVKVVASDVR